MVVRRFERVRQGLWLVAAALTLLAVGLAILGRRMERVSANESFSPLTSGEPVPLERNHLRLASASAWNDSFGDGWPDVARLETPSDRVRFAYWLTYLAESVYYQPAPRALEEVRDCAALVRFAYRNALAAHTPAWHQSIGMRLEPGFGGVEKFDYPAWPLGRGLFRTKAGAFASSDLASGVFQEFADAETLLRYNTFAVSRVLGAARAGDLLFFHQPEQAEPYHVMLFVGRSHFQPAGSDWIVYHTGDVNGRPGEIRHVQAGVLAQHPEPRWRPLEGNTRFLGVFRFCLLR